MRSRWYYLPFVEDDGRFATFMARDRSNRFNAKGRQSGLNKLRENNNRRANKRNAAADEQAQSNQEMVIPKTREEKQEEQMRKAELRRDVR